MLPNGAQFPYSPMGSVGLQISIPKTLWDL